MVVSAPLSASCESPSGLAGRFCSIVVDHPHHAVDTVLRRLSVCLPFLVAPVRSCGIYIGRPGPGATLHHVGGFGSEHLLAELSARAVLNNRGDLARPMVLPPAGDRIGSLLCAPLVKTDSVLGLLVLERPAGDGVFCKDELIMLVTVGRRVGRRLADSRMAGGTTS